MKRIRALATAGLMIATGMVAAPTSTASAATTAWGDCAVGRFCAWRDADANFMILTKPVDFNTSHQLAARDQLTSFYNHSSYYIEIWDWNAGRNCWDSLAYTAPGAWGNIPGWANDRADVITGTFGHPPGQAGRCS